MSFKGNVPVGDRHTPFGGSGKPRFRLTVIMTVAVPVDFLGRVREVWSCCLSLLSCRMPGLEIVGWVSHLPLPRKSPMHFFIALLLSQPLRSFNAFFLNESHKSLLCRFSEVKMQHVPY